MRKQSEYEQNIQDYIPVFTPVGSDGKRLTPFTVYRKMQQHSGAESIVCPPGDVFLANQNDVDAFGALGCIAVTGNLIIDDSGNSPKVTDLTPLSNLTSVTGIFKVTVPQLSNLAGLSKLGAVG